MVIILGMYSILSERAIIIYAVGIPDKLDF